ncbi:MAG: glucosyltransferase domain-containing protein [Clostridia bacterium]|nr:glucosyltransferase domain-containing protein [Clostridia bacterium]
MRSRLRPWVWPALITAVIWLLWGPLACSANLRFDSDLMLTRPEETLSRYVSEGRFGLALLLRLFGLNTLNPLRSGLLFLLFFTGAAWLLAGLLKRFSGRSDPRALCGFVLLYATSPVWAYQVYFTLQIAPVGLGLLLTAALAGLDARWHTDGQPVSLRRGLGLAASTALLCLSLSIYQALILHYLAAAAMLTLCALLKGKRLRGRDSALWGLRVLLSVGGYLLLARLIRGGGSAYLQQQIAWGREPLGVCLRELVFAAGKTALPIHSACFSAWSPGAALLLLLLGRRRREGEKPSAMLILVSLALLILPLAMNLALGGKTVPRTQMALQMTAAFLPACYLLFAPGEHRPLRVLCLLLAALQAALVVRLWHTDNVRAAEDLAAARALSADIETLDAADKPLLFIGERAFIDDSLLMEKKDVYGRSFLEWAADSGAPGRVTPDAVRLLEAASGREFRAYAGWEEPPEELLALAEAMPLWPADGSVLAAEDAVIIRLGE